MRYNTYRYRRFDFDYMENTYNKYICFGGYRGNGYDRIPFIYYILELFWSIGKQEYLRPKIFINCKVTRLWQGNDKIMNKDFK